MARGFSLVETLFAALVSAVALVALAQLVAVATRADQSAAASTSAVVLAAQKLEQLRALLWTFDVGGGAVSDTSTDTAEPGSPQGGTGLKLSPADTLSANTSGYCDFLDARGRTLGRGAAPPPGAAFERRWSIASLGASNDTLVVQVVVMPVGGGPGARLVGIRTRKGG